MIKNSFIFILIFFLACSREKINKQSSILGEWKASALLVSGNSTTLDISSVKLIILSNSRYYYTNNIGQSEAGTFIVKDSLFITTDTTKNPAVENAVHIIKADNDSLILRMNLGGKEGLMYLSH